MNTLIAFGGIIVIIVLYFLYKARKKKVDESVDYCIDTEDKISDMKTSVDVASEMLESHKRDVSSLSENMLSWNNNGIYGWDKIAKFISQNPLSVKFNMGNCPKCSAPLNEIEYISNGINTDLFICKECKAQFDINKKELVNNSQVATNQNELINLHIAGGDLISDHIKSTLANLNPNLIPLLSAIKELNCAINIHNSEYLDFVYKGKTFLVWFDEENLLYYPNWHRIDKTEFSQDLICRIQALNHIHFSCTYWLCDAFTKVEKYYYLSSNIDINTYTNKPIDCASLQKCLDILISESDITIESFNYPIEHKLTNCEDKLKVVAGLLRNTYCQDVNQDEDGDINFKYNGHHMYIKILDSNHIRAFWNCQEFNDATENINSEEEHDAVDLVSMFIQWSNLGYKYKYTYYKPTDTRHSMTAYLDLYITPETTAEYINEKLAEFTHFIDNSNIMDEDYYMPIHDYFLPVISEFNNFNE